MRANDVLSVNYFFTMTNKLNKIFLVHNWLIYIIITDKSKTLIPSSAGWFIGLVFSLSLIIWYIFVFHWRNFCKDTSAWSGYNLLKYCFIVASTSNNFKPICLFNLWFIYFLRNLLYEASEEIAFGKVFICDKGSLSSFGVKGISCFSVLLQFTTVLEFALLFLDISQDSSLMALIVNVFVFSLVSELQGNGVQDVVSVKISDDRTSSAGLKIGCFQRAYHLLDYLEMLILFQSMNPYQNRKVHLWF